MVNDDDLQTSALDPRPVVAMLRNGRGVEGILAVGNGQTLVRYLATRRTLINLTSVVAPWSYDGQVRHLALSVDHILWVRSADGQIPLTPLAAMPMLTRVVLHLEGGSVIRANMDLAFNERMSDHLDIARPFLALFHAATDDQELGDIALNAAAVTAAREALADEEP